MPGRGSSGAMGQQGGVEVEFRPKAVKEVTVMLF